ncbi:protein-disulfide reductase DsbD family protein [Croceibacterium ferulae]|uniref:protein-disulfide reductase DsbD family protein n=1 Tax=Croceibacterium ferulae TaxID=1854641 RepID=UPI001F4D77B0|nr:protein-disulfide reductase DsbD domain-containing protein [Croceibacterium ferulae]
MMAVIRCLLALLALWVVPAHAQVAPPTHIAPELAVEQAAVPGAEVTLALAFRPEAGWHGYWSNPGDAGYGMRLDWTLPDGWSVGDPLYPVPQRLLIGGLMNHVYEGPYAVLLPLRVPAGASGIVPIQVQAEWLACTDQICVPESATLTLRLAVTGSGLPLPVRDTRFDQWRAALPPLIDQPARFELTEEALRIAIPLPASAPLGAPHLFLQTEQVVDYGGEQRFFRAGDLLVAELPRASLRTQPQTIAGVLTTGEGMQGLRFAGIPGPVPSGGDPVGDAAAPNAPFWALIGGALLGGLILNLMPCVFPILSLKALTLARAGESAGGARREALAYSAGVLLACLALGGLLLALRAGGSQIGWAFQLQQPAVVVALLVLSLAITANLAGLYELPALSFTRAGGRSSAFATGLLAAFVATPCTGPFMAAAMGAALLLPWWQGLVLFAILGLGLALPFLALGFVPALRRMLPRPGAWMQRLQRVLAVPMGLTALGLLWLAWRLGGTGFALLALALAVLVVGLLVLWRRSEWAKLAGAAALCVAVAAVLPFAHAEPAASDDAGLLAPEPFSEAALAQARASGKPVFVWFTADWCLTCKVNEGAAIEREATRAAFEQAGAVALRGDWTRSDPAITRFLTAHGAAGVPLYLWYAPGAEAQVLPQVLSPGILPELARRR